ncbi:Scr1 family TA system antitoxin-like transcriptional regulator [Streptomyces niveus]
MAHPPFVVALGEQAFSTNGGPEVMHGQLDHFLAVVSLPRLSLGIAPPQHPWRSGPATRSPPSTIAWSSWRPLRRR